MGVSHKVTPVVSPQTRAHEAISAACNQAIVAGIDVTLADGQTGHFSLTENDQINLNGAVSAVQQGAQAYPYHADGEVCRVYPAADILTIGRAATAHKLYHTTYANHVFRWIERTTDPSALAQITYGAPLPDDLQESMDAILAAVGA